MKKTIRMTESELHSMISESVKRVLNETHGYPEDLESAQNDVRKDAIDKIYSLTEDIFEDYFNYQNQWLDNYFSDNEDGLYLSLPYSQEADYQDIDSRLQDIGWEYNGDDGDGLPTYKYEEEALNYPVVDTPQNRKKQQDRADNVNFQDPLIANFRNRQKYFKPSPDAPLRHSARQLGYDDKSNDNELSGTNWRNNIEFTNLNEAIRKTLRKYLR